MDISLYVMISWFVGFAIGLITMYGIIEISFYREERRKRNRDRSMLDFAEYVAEERKKKQIDFNLFENAGGSFDEQKTD